MLMTLFAVLLFFWFAGVISAHTAGGFIHVLLALAVAAVLFRIAQGHRPV